MLNVNEQYRPVSNYSGYTATRTVSLPFTLVQLIFGSSNRVPTGYFLFAVK